MLQQTRIAVVAPAYERFVTRFPAIAALAAASEDEVLSAWSGLGYYRRARNLHAAARSLTAVGETRFPRDRSAALALPGVGAYTSAAVLSIAFGQVHAAVDGNVVRVLSRLARLPPPDGRGQPHAAVAEALLDPERPGDWNQALMELGQRVCTPRAPSCGGCPLVGECQAHAADVVDAYPVPRARPAREAVDLDMLVVHDRRGAVLLERGVFPHLDHLWLPLTRTDDVAGTDDVERESVRHAIVKRDFCVRVWSRCEAAERLRERATRSAVSERKVFAPADLADIGRSSLLIKVLRCAQLLD